MRLIDADHLRRWILSRVFKTQLSVADVIDQIDRELTIEPERKNGKWVKVHWKAFRCSECNRVSEFFTNFCPNCGADMRGDNDDKSK